MRNRLKGFKWLEGWQLFGKWIFPRANYLVEFQFKAV